MPRQEEVAFEDETSSRTASANGKAGKGVPAKGSTNRVKIRVEGGSPVNVNKKGVTFEDAGSSARSASADRKGNGDPAKESTSFLKISVEGGSPLKATKKGVTVEDGSSSSLSASAETEAGKGYPAKESKDLLEIRVVAGGSRSMKFSAGEGGESPSSCTSSAVLRKFVKGLFFSPELFRQCLMKSNEHPRPYKKTVAIAKSEGESAIASGSSGRDSLKIIMSAEHPYLVWQEFTLLIAGLSVDAPGQDQDRETVRGNYQDELAEGLEILGHIIDVYPDIIQRELFRDSYQLKHVCICESGGVQPERYGVLHAAMLTPGLENLVKLMRDPDTCREKIHAEILRRANGSEHNVWDEFYNFQTIILWRFMQSQDYAKLAEFMKEIEKALLKGKNLEAFLDKILELRSTGTVEPRVIWLAWVAFLAWTAISPGLRSKILEQLKRSRRWPNLLEKIRTDLENLSSFAPFLEMLGDRDAHAQEATEPPVTVEKLVELLVLERKDGGHWEGDDFGDQNQDLDQNFEMEILFLDRLCERTPKSLWTPLHLAAARGDQQMVRLLIDSCDMNLRGLEKGLEETYTAKLQESFCDAMNMTPLHYGVLGDCGEAGVEVVKALVSWKIFHPYVNECDILMRTALQIACSNEQRMCIVRELVKNPEVKIDIEDCCEFTPLHWSVKFGYADTAKFLIEKRLTLTKGGLVSLIMEHAREDIQQQLLCHDLMVKEVDRLYRDRQVYVDAANAILVVAALIASVTFGGWLQIPLGSNRGTSKEIQMFWTFNSLSFFFSIATVMAGAGAVLPMGGDNMDYAVKIIRRWLIVTSFMLIFSVIFVLAAFAAAGFSALTAVPGVRYNMIVTTSIGSFICGIVAVVFCYRLFRIPSNFERLGAKIQRRVKFLKDLLVMLAGRIKEKRVKFKHFRRMPSEQPGQTTSPPEHPGTLKIVLNSIPALIDSLKHERSLIPQPLVKSMSRSATSTFDEAVLKSMSRSATSTLAKSNVKSSPMSLSSAPQVSVVREIRESIRELFLEKTHPQGSSVRWCPIRTNSCYLGLESHCFDQIMNLEGFDEDTKLEKYTTIFAEAKKEARDEDERVLTRQSPAQNKARARQHGQRNKRPRT